MQSPFSAHYLPKKEFIKTKTARKAKLEEKSADEKREICNGGWRGPPLATRAAARATVDCPEERFSLAFNSAFLEHCAIALCATVCTCNN